MTPKLTTPITATTFNTMRQQDRARIKPLNDLPTKESNISTRFRKLLSQLAPDKIELNLSGEMVFLKTNAHFTWDLARRRLERDLNEDQKMRFLKRLYGK